MHRVSEGPQSIFWGKGWRMVNVENICHRTRLSNTIKIARAEWKRLTTVGNMEPGAEWRLASRKSKTSAAEWKLLGTGVNRVTGAEWNAHLKRKDQRANKITHIQLTLNKFTSKVQKIQNPQFLFPLCTFKSFCLRFKVFWLKFESKCRSLYTKALLENWKWFCSKQ